MRTLPIALVLLTSCVDQYEGQCGSAGSGGPFEPGSKGTLEFTVASNTIEDAAIAAALPANTKVQMPCVSWIDAGARKSGRAGTLPEGDSSDNPGRRPKLALEIVYEGSTDAYKVVTFIPASGGAGSANPVLYHEGTALAPLEIAPGESSLKITQGSSLSFSRLEFKVSGAADEKKVVLTGGAF